MAVAVTESWIRDRVRLNHNNLGKYHSPSPEDVRSLSLPGTYHEKIASLGESLRNFTRLKSLDLSRNAIESLQGLESLKMLEKLILYYNNVPSLQELYRLRYNQRIQELDLRLNPVARNEPDYRLFLIHMLPNLRRLDDRAVRDSERKAALMHFTTDQASELTQHPPRPPTSQPSANPRAELVKSLAKPPSAVDQDDAVLLDFAGKTTAELLAPRKITGSANTKPHMEEYPPQVARQMDCANAKARQVGLVEPFSLPFPQLDSSDYMLQQDGLVPKEMPADVTSGQQRGGKPIDVQTHTEPGSVLLPQVAEDLQKKYPNLMGPALTQISEKQNSQQYGYQLQVPKPSAQSADTDDANLKFQDEIEAYTSYKAQGHFTPHPDLAADQGEAEPSPGDEDHRSASQKNEKVTGRYESPAISASAELYPARNKQVEEKSPSRTEFQQPAANPNAEMVGESQSDDMPAGVFGQFLSQISSLADKYWNGSKSLLKNSRFKAHLSSIYQELTSGVPVQTSDDMSNAAADQIARLQQKLHEAQEENRRLQERASSLAESIEGSPGDDGKDKGSLIRAQRDLSILRSRLQKSLEENKALQDRIALLESGHHLATERTDPPSTEAELSNIDRENERLRSEITSLNIRLKQASQMQELAAMLQESHKSLVQTNDHLLRELEETRQRHAAEVKQLHWSYDQLKKHVSMSSQYGQTKTYNGAT